jgi:hypothetical protein
MSNLIQLDMNTSMAAVTQNVVDLFESIKAHYVVNYVKSTQGSGFGFQFGHNPICEHSIKTGYQKPTASLRIANINNELITKIFGEKEHILCRDYGWKSTAAIKPLQLLADEYFAGVVEIELHDNMHFNVDITNITPDVIKAVSELLQHSNMAIRATPATNYRC